MKKKEIQKEDGRKDRERSGDEEKGQEQTMRGKR
jgi:hypothetical protein